jgi:hypothetical protein
VYPYFTTKEIERRDPVEGLKEKEKKAGMKEPGQWRERGIVGTIVSKDGQKREKKV